MLCSHYEDLNFGSVNKEMLCLHYEDEQTILEGVLFPCDT